MQIPLQKMQHQVPIISLYAIIKNLIIDGTTKNYIQTQPHTNINQHHIKDEKWLTISTH